MSEIISAISRHNSEYFDDAKNEPPPDTKSLTTITEELKPLNLSDPAQMVMIDKLRDLKVEVDKGLPQLVVVGDQSSGKSSVLEAIMNFPLPRNSGLCTRFATNIILRRSDHTQISISIIAGKDSGSLRTREIDLFNETFQKQGVENLHESRFKDILAQASH